MAFDKERLRKIVNTRRKGLEGQELVQEAALAYARWQGFTDEEGLDREQAKGEMDRLLDVLEGDVEAWERSKELVGLIDDRVLAGLLLYSMERSDAFIREISRGLEATQGMPERIDALARDLEQGRSSGIEARDEPLGRNENDMDDDAPEHRRRR